MRDKNSAFEADSVPEGLGLGEGVRGGATWVGAACRSGGGGVRDISQRLEGRPSAL